MRPRLLYQFILDKMSLLMLNETEQLAENHGADEAMEAGREIGCHASNRRHRSRRNHFVIGALAPMRRKPLLQFRQRLRRVERHIIVDIHDDKERPA